MVKYLRVKGEEMVVDENRARPTPFHSPSEALQTHYDLLDWIDTDHGLDVTRTLMRTRQAGQFARDENDEQVPGDDITVTEGYRSVLWDTVNHNNTMFVSAHMCDQLQALIPSFEDEPIWHTDLPDEKGVVLFEAAIRSVLSGKTDEVHPDDDPLEYWIKGFAYRRVYNQQVEVFRKGLHMVITIAPPPTQEPGSDERMAAFEQNDGLLIWPLFDAGEMFVAPGQWIEKGQPPVLPMPFVAIPFGPKVNVFAQYQATTTEEAFELNHDLAQMRDLVVTLFRLIWQHIIVEDDHFPRPEQRRIDRIARKRKRLPDDGEEIKVRHLRRLEVLTESSPRDVDAAHEGHTLTYRIIVRGHPREQHYPSLGPARIDGQWNPESHRKIWIDAHIRGPEDAPLVLKHSLDAVVR